MQVPASDPLKCPAPLYLEVKPVLESVRRVVGRLANLSRFPKTSHAPIGALALFCMFIQIAILFISHTLQI